MTIKHLPTIEKYASQVMDMRAVIANLQEFVATLPAPDENENLPGMHYGHTGPIDHIHTLLTQAMEAADEFSGN